ncbi:MAG: TM0106 family RecB-like putative nuclease [Brevundimonas sp.]|uniref:TM0106 family RecB-like putative nuclease n=1 Tax=Brevundimonas sp. TaxID=1871086 RepID=UPI00271817A0|nr:TM0106 family RecB-like putative nuclease [Brevundimonas sp.]MDO9589028.1 TM0106 family RecB-like putative nuclease [Brevundimonas sp.]
MRRIDGKLRLSASDLMRFQGCRHATALDLRYLDDRSLTPDADTDDALLLQRQGDDHELNFLETLRSSGRVIAEIDKDGLALEESVDRTLAALRTGADIVFQGAFLEGAWGGYSDFLEKVEAPSALGDFSYEVIDTKLKRKPDPKHVLQLSLYSDLLAKVQGRAPERAHLELGDGSRFSVDLAGVSDYARHARGRLETFLQAPGETRPEPVAGCGLCRWRSSCRAGWEAADSLTLVAGISAGQREKLQVAGVTTMAQLGALSARVPGMASTTQDRLTVQAALQTARRAGGPPAFSLRPPEAGRGLALLPPTDPGDVFYDIEGDPYYPDGLEYLHGLWFQDNGQWRFQAFWAHDREAEGEAVAGLLGFLTDHFRRHPAAHLYHYANYEVAALRRLTTQHRRGEAAMDQLQRERRFVDLHRVVAGGLQASEPGYSIKDLEAFYMEKRSGDVATAGASVVVYERWRESGDPDLLEQIRDYNETDCRSTQLLRDWLVSAVRPADMAWRAPGPVPEDGAMSTVAVDEAAQADLHQRLTLLEARFGAAVVDLLADLHVFHAREDKPSWWAIFDRLSRESEELLDDLDCLAGLEAVGPAVPDKRSMARTYRYPMQETKFRAGRKPCVKPADGPLGVDLSEMQDGILVLRATAARYILPDRLDLLPAMPLKNTTLRDGIAAVAQGLLNAPDRLRAVGDLLGRSPPRFVDGLRPGGVIDPAGDLTAQTCQAVAAMDETVLAIQGPPGTGKTWVSAAAIVELVRSGQRVAVSSNSHKAIGNLLEAIARRARSEGVRCSIVQKVSGDDDADTHPDIVTVRDNKAPEIGGAHVVGATAWHFATYDAPAFSHLFVDEAGQVSLANLLAMARSARNLVLAGDPMQLPQPIQGDHPGLSASSCLEYLMGDDRVIPGDRGIFLPVTRRMHPGVCEFISRAVYEGRLHPDAEAASQTLVARDGHTALTGARLEPVTHAGRSQVCPEEVDAIVQAVLDLTGSLYTDRDGATRPVSHQDILVVAPYNAQVNALRAALPAEVRVGTVDRFQGQEAPVCLISMTTSSADELPRDIEFLFSLNRINVAVSRAQAAAIVFASPALLETPCRTVEQMRLVNTLCLLGTYQPSGG